MKSLLIGFGSIGRRHLRELSARSNEVIVFDFKNSYPQLVEEVGNASFHSEWNELVTKHKKFDLAVISTWGPNHLAQLRNIIDLGINSVLVEKPLGSSLRDVEEIVRITECNKIRLFENFHFRYGNFRSAIQNFEKNFELGSLLQFNVTGGAKCIATTGIHYLDLCEWILSSRPVKIVSDLSYRYINPRSPQLRIYGGLVRWSYPTGTTLTMNFSNDSYCEATIELLWKNAKAVFEGETLTLYGPEDFPSCDQFTTARVKPFIRELSHASAIRDTSENDGMTNLYNAFFDPSQRYRNQSPGSSTKDLISALISSEVNRGIDSVSDADNFMDVDWEIS